jgi:glycosyltransferase involved in cell wall biosynthesis
MKRLLRLEHRVQFAGLVTGEALDRLFRQATVFALATRFEGYGMVFGEALLHGLPIVTCATGAVPETVPADAGLLVPPDDPQAFAAALEQVLTDAGLRGRMAAAATTAGQRLPRWADTAAVMGQAVDRAATR